MLDKLDRTTRLRLLRMVAAAAWLDGEIHDKERAFVEKLLEKMKVPPDEMTTVRGYLDKPPHPAEIDPSKLPPELRETLVKLVWQLIGSDENVDEEELATVRHLEELLG